MQNFQNGRHNYGIKLSKSKFATIISKKWSEVSSALLIKGFEKGGIYPFNNEVISTEKFNPESYKRWVSENRKNDSKIIVSWQSTVLVLEEQIS